MPKQTLGRGLSSLIPQKPKPQDTQPVPLTQDARKFVAPLARKDWVREESVFYIEIEKIHPNPQQPRKDFAEESLKDLAESIRTHGIIQPLVVTKHEHQTSRGQEVWYELVAGERRLRASKLVGLKHIPVIIREAEEQQKLEVALIENLQRHDLNALEEAKAFRKLADTFGLSQQEISLRVGKSRSAVANTLRLLDLPQEIQKGLEENKITEGHARALLGVRDVVAQLAFYNDVVQKNLSVRDVEEMARAQAMQAGTRKERITRTLDPEVREFQSKLEGALGTKVRLKGGTGRGKIVVEFYSREELQSILARILKS